MLPAVSALLPVRLMIPSLGEKSLLITVFETQTRLQNYSSVANWNTIS
jgi:hypothetical protein